MKKRGQIIELFGLLLIVGITIMGVYQMYYSVSSIYVEDTNTSIVYKYSECKDFINSLPKERLIVFSSKEKIPSNLQIGKCK